MQIYNVAITPYTVAANDQTVKGFIDNTTVAQYLAVASQPNGFTLSKSQAKSQGNLRWKFILQSMALMANPYVSNVTATGAAMDTDATEFSFDVYFERDSCVTTVDANGNILNGTAAVQYVVGQALITAQTHVVEFYNPTTTTSVQNGQTTAAYDYNDQNVSSLVVGALAADITTAIANITVTIAA